MLYKMWSSQTGQQFAYIYLTVYTYKWTTIHFGKRIIQSIYFKNIVKNNCQYFSIFIVLYNLLLHITSFLFHLFFLNKCFSPDKFTLFRIILNVTSTLLHNGISHKSRIWMVHLFRFHYNFRDIRMKSYWY